MKHIKPARREALKIILKQLESSSDCLESILAGRKDAEEIKQEHKLIRRIFELKAEGRQSRRL